MKIAIWAVIVFVATFVVAPDPFTPDPRLPDQENGPERQGHHPTVREHPQGRVDGTAHGDPGVLHRADHARQLTQVIRETAGEP